MLNGLVLTGGKSSRMGQDKAFLNYHGKPQVEFMVDLLRDYCDDVFVSTRVDQANHPILKQFKQIHDATIFSDAGPIAGIMSAMQQQPSAAWLIVACDLPLITTETLAFLIKHRNPTKCATAFVSSHDHLPEPLCSIYEPTAFTLLQKHFQAGKTCPRKFLINNDVNLLSLPQAHMLDNVNAPTDFHDIQRILNKNKE